MPFSFGRPQRYAALLLLALGAQCLWRVSHAPFSEHEYMLVARGVDQFGGLSSSTPLPALLSAIPNVTTLPQWISRLPALSLCLWLGGGLWWVARRLYGNPGGYLALALYCFSPPIIAAGSSASPHMLEAWGGFGIVFTAIGLAHTLYAPIRLWRARVVILALAIGFTASAHLAAALIAIALGLGFMLYLAPGRRFSALAIMLIAASAGFGILALSSGGDLHAIARTTAHLPRLVAYRGYHSPFASDVLLDHLPYGALLLLISIAALATWSLWPRARYFGNTAPLLAALIFFAAALAGSAVEPSADTPYFAPALIALPFLYVFIGGIAADVLERHPLPAFTQRLARSRPRRDPAF